MQNVLKPELNFQRQRYYGKPWQHLSLNHGHEFATGTADIFSPAAPILRRPSSSFYVAFFALPEGQLVLLQGHIDWGRCLLVRFIKGPGPSFAVAGLSL